MRPIHEQLVCEFKDEIFNILGPLYSCDVSSLDNQCNRKIITGHNGDHKANKMATDVKAIWIKMTNTKYIPEGLGSLFNLTAFQIFKSELVEIKSKDFKGMENLENLILNHNQLTSMPSVCFPN